MSQAPDNSNGEQAPNESASSRGSSIRSLDVIFELLAVERRRNALYALYRHSGPMTVVELAEEVAAVEGASTERVAAGLHHVHLPKLVAAGVANYDADRDCVDLADPSDRLRKYLTTAAEDECGPLRRASESATLSEF